MRLMQFYFSPHGRVSRRDFWLRLVLPSFLLQLAAMGMDGALGSVSIGPLADIEIVGEVLNIALYWPWAAVSIKRLHDVGKSGWWYGAFVLVAAALYIAYQINPESYAAQALILPGLIACLLLFYFTLFKRGDVGPNKYGLDPVYEAANAIG